MRILLTGGGGMLGAAIQRLNSASSEPLALFAPARGELDCADQSAVAAYFRRHRFDMVIHAAAKVGGIGANIADPVGFLTENLALNLSVIGAAAETGVPQLINIGSSCMYPKDYRQPLVEEDLLQGPLEPTNEGYALAKIAAARSEANREMQKAIEQFQSELDAMPPAERRGPALIVDLGVGQTRLARDDEASDATPLVQVNAAAYDRKLAPQVPQVVSVCLPGLQSDYARNDRTWTEQRARDAALIRDGLDWPALEALVKRP